MANIGDSWQSVDGLRTIEDTLQHNGELLYCVRTGASAFHDLFDAKRLERQREIDAANLAYRAKRDADHAEKERAETDRRANCPLERYLATLPAMKAGRARKSLEIYTRVNGNTPAPRWKQLLALHAAGYRHDGAGRFVQAGNPAFLSADDFTTFGRDFLEGLGE